MSLMLERDHAESEYAQKPSFGRTVARVLLLSVVVTALVAGLYMAFGGNKGTDPLATGASAAKPPAAAKAAASAAAPAAAAKPPTYAEQVAAAAAQLPKGTLSTGAKRTALINYLGKVGIKVTAASSPATAATTACGYLGNGYDAKKMIGQVASGGGYTTEQSRAFLLGASSLYCPSYAKNFR